MLKRSRWTWMGVAVAGLAAAAPLAIQAQEYLPPVIDRSGGVMQSSRPVAQPAVAPKAVLSIDERIKRLERLLDNEALVDMLMRMDTMQTESQERQGEVENLNHAIESIKQRQRDLYLDMDRRLRQLELAASKPAAATAPASAASAVPTPGLMVTPAATAAMPAAAPAAVAPLVAADPAAERDTYQQAFDLLKQGQYDQAITAFQSFLASYPTGNFTDNAQYWLGEANYVTRRFEVAEQEFRKVLEQHPDSSKSADAMLKLGYTYYELSNWESARKTLEGVISHFPNTTVGRLAENRLQKMRLEGR